MSLKSIIEAIANQADDLFEGVSSRDHARAGISEQITMDYSHLSPVDRQRVTDGVMAILEEEGFFNATPGGGGERDDDESSED